MNKYLKVLLSVAFSVRNVPNYVWRPGTVQPPWPAGEAYSAPQSLYSWIKGVWEGMVGRWGWEGKGAVGPSFYISYNTWTSQWILTRDGLRDDVSFENVPFWDSKMKIIIFVCHRDSGLLLFGLFGCHSSVQYGLPGEIVTLRNDIGHSPLVDSSWR